jgi:hypothetical protein
MASDSVIHPVNGSNPLGSSNSQATGDHETSHTLPTYAPQTSEPGGPQSAKVETNTPDPSHSRFPRISRPVELLRTSYDVVVVGSGYGGGVAASRMARGRQSVCLLELGKEKWPGEYPTKLKDAMKELHVSGDFAPGRRSGRWVEGGDPTGLYHLVVGEGQNAFVGNGLGGTSLLNANVFLEADEKVLEMGVWPEELKGKNAWEKCKLRFPFYIFHTLDVTNFFFLEGGCLFGLSKPLLLLSLATSFRQCNSHGFI